VLKNLSRWISFSKVGLSLCEKLIGQTIFDKQKSKELMFFKAI